MNLKAYAAKTDQGPYLNVNEDDIKIDLLNNLYMIFDGFGGAGIGDQVVKKVKNDLINNFTKLGGDPDSTMPFYYSQKYLPEGNALINSMLIVNKELCKENQKQEMMKRGGTSAIISALSESIITFVSTGHCLCCLHRQGKMERIINPDTIGLLLENNYQRHLQTSPLSGFGLFEDLYLQIKEVRILEGDIFLLLTDGAYARLVMEELKFIIEKNINNLNAIVDEIINTSNSKGNLDNQSIVVLNF